jgi:two-component system chemotaxis response regulator CheY
VHRLESARRHHQSRPALPVGKQHPSERQLPTVVQTLDRISVDSPAAPLSLDERDRLFTDRAAADMGAQTDRAQSAVEVETDLTIAEARSAHWILVLDSDASARGRLVGALRDAGYEVQEAVDGAAALEQMRESVPELVFADAGASSVNGSAFFNLWSRAGGRQVPLILTSASVDDQELADRLGATGCLRKPYVAEEILATAVLLCELPAVRAQQPERRRFESLAGLLTATLHRMAWLLRLGARPATRPTAAS